MIEEGFYNPCIIVGAPRSGTNMLRDILCRFEGIATWPCDEINYIWRYGNIHYPSDEIPAHLATSNVQRYIKKQFEWVRKRYNSDIVIEKTCANSLRVPFVDHIIPEAKYVFIYRDGIDASGSAMLRWKARLDIPYILKKLRFVPLSDVPYYGMRYFWSRLYRLFSRDNRLAYWGPTLDGMQEILEQYSLNEVCALQWQRCVENAENAFEKMSSDKVIRVWYEDFVKRPEEELTKILAFINVEAVDQQIRNAVSGVSDKSIGKGRAFLGQKEVARLESLVGETLERYGYCD